VRTFLDNDTSLPEGEHEAQGSAGALVAGPRSCNRPDHARRIDRKDRGAEGGRKCHLAKLNANPEPAHAVIAGMEVKLGKLAPRKDPKTLKFAKYLPTLAKLPKPPAKVTRIHEVSAWPMFGNDTLGDCTCAAVGHYEQQLAAAAGSSDATPTDAEVIALYWATGDGSGTARHGT